MTYFLHALGKIFLFSFLLLLLPTPQLQAQKSLTDSLYQVYEAETEDSLKAVALHKVIIRFIRTNPDSAIRLASRNVEYGESSGQDRIKAQALIDMAQATVRTGNYEKALELNHEAREICENLPDSNLLSVTYQGIGIANRHLGKFEESMEAQLTVVKILEKIGGSPQPLARAYNNIAAVHAEIGEHKKAIENFRNSLDIWRKENNPESMAICFINIGGQAVSLDDFELAEENLQLGLHIFDSLQLNYGIGAAAANLGNLYMRHEEHAKAKEQFQIALDQYTQLGDGGRQAMFLSDLGLAEKFLRNYPTAIKLQKQAFEKAEQAKRLTTMRDAQERLAELYELTGKFTLAYRAQKIYYKLADSIFNENTAAQLNELELKYQGETKDREISFLKKEQELQATQNTWLTIGILLLCLLSFISIYALLSSRSANRKLRIAQEKGAKLLIEKEDLIKQLKQTQIQLIQQEKMASLGQLSAGIAHEINNPVNFVSGNAEALNMDLNEIKPLLEAIARLETDEAPEKILADLRDLHKKVDTRFLMTEIFQLSESIQRGSKRIQTIVGSLKSFSHSSGEDFQEVDLNELIDSTLAILTHKLKLKDAQLHKDYGEFPKIMCQPGKISQVSMNMLDNAIDAISREGNIHISTWSEDEKIFMRIKDDGIGISEEVKTKIYDPFFTTKEIGEGSGLGLAISYGIVKDHGGEIQLQHQDEPGTSFLITLPLAQQS